jgi:hypothetical protein
MTEDEDDDFRPVRTLVGLSGITAYLLYVYGWSFADAFYITFGVHVEEVGLDQAALIGRAAVSAAYFGAPFFALMIYLYGLARRRTRLRNIASRWKALPLLESSAIILASVLAVGFVIAISASALGSMFGQRVIDSPGPNTPFDSVTTGASVNEVEAVWLSKQPSGYNDGDTLLLLGNRDGITILYDVSNYKLFKIPSSTIMLTES